MNCNKIFITIILVFSYSLIYPKSLEQLWCQRGHFNLDQAYFFQKLSNFVKPKYIIETGFCTGRSAASLLRSNNNILKFISIDIDLDYIPEGREYASVLMKEFPNFKVIENNSKQVLNDEFLKTSFPKGIDWATIDGDHSYYGCLNDISQVSKFLNTEGIIVIDDYKSGPPNGVTIVDVTNAVNDFIKQNTNFFKLDWNKHGKGFCLLSKSKKLINKIINEAINA